MKEKENESMKSGRKGHQEKGERRFKKKKKKRYQIMERGVKLERKGKY